MTKELIQVSKGEWDMRRMMFALQKSEHDGTLRKAKVMERLKTRVMGIESASPIWVGAGVSKNGLGIKALYNAGAAVEVGSVTADPQPGNPGIRFEWVNNGIALNHFGLNSLGMHQVAHNLEKYNGDVPYAVSIVKNKNTLPKDAPKSYAKSARLLLPGAKYGAINVSSPNSPGLRDLQDKKYLWDIGQAVNEVSGQTPIFIKVSPDNNIDDVIDVASQLKMGIIAANTTSGNIKTNLGEPWASMPGGISGQSKEYLDLTTNMVRFIHNSDREIPIIASGGVMGAKSAIEKIRAGAFFVQIVTAVLSYGPDIISDINCGIYNYMLNRGIKSLEEIRGQD